MLSSGTYTLKKTLVIDYASRAGSGFRLISRGARIDGTAIHNGPVLSIVCSGGATANPKGCFYFHQEGTLFVNADTPDYAVRFGFDDLSDAHNSAKIDHRIINNRDSSGTGGSSGRSRTESTPTVIWFAPSRSTFVTSKAKGVKPPRCSPSLAPLIHTLAA